MPFDFWGADSPLRLDSPDRPGFYILLILYLLGIGAILWRSSGSWGEKPGRSGLVTLLLAAGGLLANLLLLWPLPLPDQLSPIAFASTPTTIAHLIGFIPVVLAGLLINPAAALLVGLSGGLGRALWSSNQLLDLFHYGLAGWLTAVLLTQTYRGQVYRWFRWPLISAPLGLILTLPLLSALSTLFAYTPAETSLASTLDLALSNGLAQFYVASVEGLVSGIFTSALLLVVQAWQPQPETLTIPPFSRTIRRRLLSRFVIYSLLLSIGLISLVVWRSIVGVRDLVVEEMARTATTVSDDIPHFLDTRHNLLDQYGQDPRLLSGDADEAREALQQLFRSGPYFRRVALVPLEPDGGIGAVSAFFPNSDTTAITLTEIEQAAIIEMIDNGTPQTTSAQDADDQVGVALVQPVGDGAALVARVANISLMELIDGMQGTGRAGEGFIVDENNRVLAHPNPEFLLESWQPPSGSERRLFSDEAGLRQAFEGRDWQDNTRSLLVYVRSEEHPWAVALSVPYAVVISLALQTSWPLLLSILIGTALFGGLLALLATNISRPLRQLVAVSQHIAAGDYKTTIPQAGNDEVGQLSRSFEQMQTALRTRVEEQALLLNVSKEVSATLNLDGGMTPILNGALRGTGASGARMVVLNPNGRYPLLYGAGPAAEEMGKFDRAIMALMRQGREIFRETPAEVHNTLTPNNDPSDYPFPFHAFIAVGLYSKNNLKGVMWLGFRQPHAFAEAERNLLNTLAGQAAVLIDNAFLYASAINGQHRLETVLRSTRDAVIVTDQTARILLVNPAAEKLFDFEADRVVNLKAADVIEQPELVGALTDRNTPDSSFDVPLNNGKTMYANVSAYTDGEAQGRVAVLRDITAMKEVDELKSDFVQMVSHDLRSPLTFMQGYVSMIPMVGEMSERQQTYLDNVERGLNQMKGMVHNLLDIGRLEAGINLVRTPTRIDHLLRMVVRDNQPAAEQNGLNLQVELPEDIPHLNIDEALVQQAVLNLITNAIKYAPESGDLLVHAACDAGNVRISVIDHGPGVPEENQPQLFEKFYRVRQRQHAKVKGSGLGLAMVKLVAERHGGDAGYQPTPGGGSTFYFTLPLSDSEPNGAEMPSDA